MQTSTISRARWLTAPVLAASLLFGGVAFAAPPAAGQGDIRDRHGRMCEELSCTEQQRSALQAIFVELREDSQADKAAIEALQKKYAEEFAKPKPDEKTLESLVSRIAKHHAELAMRRHDAMMEAHALLDAKQRVKFAQMVEHRGPGKWGRGGHKGKGEGKRPVTSNKSETGR